ncbi:PspC domain-containing protein [Corynebacterium aurimucosum]|uniref:PspC domain-containing protein n=1 Tax=Corynebacterium aurimucosum TaxID=169292 RepID=A0A558GG07_9CORY|nr:PspC domain-containing protein [Corynebacterium aurimucosum]
MDTNSSFQAMWDTRPPRIPKEQGGNPLVGGICEGIGARYNVDVTFVRWGCPQIVDT